jgi:hypothetical protein
MKAFTLCTLIPFGFTLLASLRAVFAQDNVTDTIISNAEAGKSFPRQNSRRIVNGVLSYYSLDGVDLTVLSFFDEALREIKAVYENAPTRRSLGSGRFAARQFAEIIDVHSKLTIIERR